MFLSEWLEKIYIILSKLSDECLLLALSAEYNLLVSGRYSSDICMC